MEKYDIDSLTRSSAQLNPTSKLVPSFQFTHFTIWIVRGYSCAYPNREKVPKYWDRVCPISYGL